MSVRRIVWICQSAGSTDPSDRGYWRSSEGRFHIYPHGFRHNLYPDGYKVEDSMGEVTCQWNRETNDFRGIVVRKERTFDTVRDCKAWALEQSRDKLEDA